MFLKTQCLEKLASHGCPRLSKLEVVDLTNETKPTIILKSHIKSFLGKYVSTKTLATTQLEPSRIPVSEVNLQNHSVGLGREAS